MNIPVPVKIVFSLFVIVLIGLGFWLTDWQKKMAEIRQLGMTESARHEELQKCKALAADLPQEQKKKQKLDRELKAVVKEQLTPENEPDFIPSAIADIERLVMQEQNRLGDRNFIICSLAPGVLQAPGKGKESDTTVLGDYPTLTFQMGLTGKFSSVTDFLRQLGALKLRRLVTINRIALAPQGEATESPLLTIQMPITAYLRKGGT